MNTTLFEATRDSTSAQTQGQVYSVNDINLLAKKLLEGELSSILVEGEVSNLARPASGHLYFTLKDEKAQIKAAFFRPAQKSSPLQLENGQKIQAKGSISLYTPRGDYQFIVKQVKLAGTGDLLAAYEALKQKLTSQGYFDEEHKKSLPSYPHQLALVTSETGAAVRDMLNVLQRRWPFAKISLFPTRVQGEGAAAEIIEALHNAQSYMPDAILLGRGGGSIEDLWCFNDPHLAQAIFDCPIPIVSGVGHQTDFTIADFVADLRAPTPSAAAELVTPDIHELMEKLQGFEQYFQDKIQSLINGKSQTLDHMSSQLKHPKQQLQQLQQRLQHSSQALELIYTKAFVGKKHQFDKLEQSLWNQLPNQKITNAKHQTAELLERLTKAMQVYLQNRRFKFEKNYHLLTGISHTKTLERGYAMVKDTDGVLITKKANLKTNQNIEIIFQDGSQPALIQSPT